VLRFSRLFDVGPALSFPCDGAGRVDLDSLGERARSNYFYARTAIGREFAMPAVQCGAPEKSMNRALLPTLQRAWSLVAGGPRDETTSDAQSRVREEPSIVAALCTCALGEREGGASAAWPPQSVAKLSGHSGGPAHGMRQDAGLLQQGSRLRRPFLFQWTPHEA
jgi:hypothetical protein